ncbi:MAG: NAD-dependent deacylase [bacterium]|nr:MAG: NAD-dependent deacylase [bacterium]
MHAIEHDREKLEQAAGRLSRSERTIVSTGSGISRESGIPTFRGEDGLWQNHRPEELASREGFLSNPGLVWRWYRERLGTARAKQPNPGHRAIARLEPLIPNFLLITQNIDNLHRRAGSKEIVELHGNIERYRCFEYSHPAEEDPQWGDEPPRCHCGSIIRPDVVWFGEPLPEAEIECAFRESARCDTFLVVGTSGMVQPAALLPQVARNAGALLIEVNETPSEITPIVDIFLQGKAGETLPPLVDRIEELVSRG